MSPWDQTQTGVLLLPDGILVRGRGLRADPVRTDRERPDLGIYLTARRPPESDWESCWIRWPDFRLPRSTSDAVRTLRLAHRRAATERVEIACDGGCGRTGTALGLLACLSGLPPEQALDWVRRHYRAGAVETPWQRRWLVQTARGLDR